MKKNFSKLLALYLPYLLLGLAATNFGEAWRLAECKEIPAWHGVRLCPVGRTQRYRAVYGSEV